MLYCESCKIRPVAPNSELCVRCDRDRLTRDRAELVAALRDVIAAWDDDNEPVRPAMNAARRLLARIDGGG